jgi:maltooligosyltrehalose synthase
VTGPAAEHVVAFARHHTTGTLVVMAPRLSLALTSDHAPWPLGEPAWAETRILLPASLPAAPYRHLLTGERVAPGAGAEVDDATVAAAGALATCPVALLWSAADPGP